MTSANAVSGSNILANDIAKFGISFIFACIGYFISIGMGGEAVFSSWLHAPFLGPAIFGGLIYIFWISLAKELCGKYYGIVVSVLIVSFFLMVGPWFSVVDPTWYGIIGIISALIMGYLTERYNGAVGLASFMIINWACFYGLAVYPSWSPTYTISGLGIAFVLSIVSGYVGDYVAKFVAKYAKSYF
ncbi:hypothetical protein [Methanothermococcus sp.]|uniref:hypothetical protein n=1 Tax=Methanothermococcus sp. TaxID=2614238 RepID=UPI0025FDF394|nr:hypothetical protein [Methanothermococcus sp.]